jgi:uncharacterized protein YjbI with pentapeptide repeats
VEGQVDYRTVEILTNDDREILAAIAKATPSKPELAFVTFARAAGKNVKTDYRGADLRGYVLCGQDLSEVNLENADLREADLRGATGYQQAGTRTEGAIISSHKRSGPSDDPFARW